MPPLHRFLLAALGSLVLFALGVVGGEFVLNIFFSAYLALPAPMPQLAAAAAEPPPLGPESEAEAQDRDAA